MVVWSLRFFQNRTYKTLRKTQTGKLCAWISHGEVKLSIKINLEFAFAANKAKNAAKGELGISQNLWVPFWGVL